MHVVFGASGGLGLSVVQALLRRELPVRAVVRSQAAFGRRFRGAARHLSTHTGDALDPAAVRSALAGATHVYHAVNVPYARWEALHPPILENLLDAAQQAGARLIFPANVYLYTPPFRGPVDERHPVRPPTRKGRLRLRLEERLWRAHAEGDVPVVMGRLPDFYGPYANSIPVVPPPGEKVLWGESRRQPHEFIYIGDAGEALVRLALDPSAYGRCWHVPGPGLITGEQWVAEMQAALGYRPGLRVFKRWKLWLAGLRNRQAGQFAELYYLWKHPLQLDGSAWREHFGEPPPTRPYREGMGETARVLGLVTELTSV